MTNQPTTVIDLQQRQWLAQFCAGDPQGFLHVVHHYQQPLYNYISRCQVADQHREDLLQEVFIKIHQSADQYKSSKPLKPWIYTIAANTVRNFFRDSQKYQQQDELNEQTTESPYPSQLQQLSDHELQRWLESQIGELPISQREALILVAIEGFSLEEAATILTVPLNTLKTHVRRARMCLTEQYAIHFADDAATGGQYV